MNIPDIARNAQRVIVQNSPLILTSFAVAGVISTTVAAVIVTPEATRRIDTASYEKFEAKDPGNARSFDREPLTKLETFKAAAPCYIPAALIGGATVAAIIFSHNIGSRRNAALVSAYTIAEKAYDEYRTKNTELNGANTDRKVADAVAVDNFQAAPIGAREVIILAGPKQLFFDEYTGRTFESTVNAVEKAVNDVNRQCNEQNFASLSEFYGLLGLESFAEVGDAVGWTADHHMEIKITTTSIETPDGGKPAFSIGFRKLPKATFDSFH